MYSLLKKVITEKDIYRQIILLEQLLNHPQLTAKELAQKIATTERTIFSDLQLIRSYLPEQWELETDSNGIRLTPHKKALTNDIWETFLPHSVSLQLIKQLFFTKELNVTHFLTETGISYETLKRQRTKINQQLRSYNIKISLTTKRARLIGDESAIRIFYHRLLLPFTHNNYFFEDYSIHEEHYLHFLEKELSNEQRIQSEQIFGICWFFINTIRSKAGCRIDHFSFEKNDALFLMYRSSLKKLYEKEGIYLQTEELFFAFFCFLESWNYNNQFGEQVVDVLATNYSQLLNQAKQTVQDIADELHLPQLTATSLTENLLLLLLKYAESPALSKQFQLEYHELINQHKEEHRFLYQKGLELFEQLPQFSSSEDTTYFINLFSLLTQQAIISVRAYTKTGYFIFQSEPAWKNFLQQKLTDLLGNRIQLLSIELSQLKKLIPESGAFIISNIPLDTPPLPVVYLSTLPTKNELSQLTELTSNSYL